MFEIPDDDEHFWEVCFYPKDFVCSLHDTSSLFATKHTSGWQFT
jgi:hypothetical protein